MEIASDKLVVRDEAAPCTDEERARKAERIRAALSKLKHLRISTEEYLREKHAELAREDTLEDA